MNRKEALMVILACARRALARHNADVARAYLTAWRLFRGTAPESTQRRWKAGA